MSEDLLSRWEGNAFVLSVGLALVLLLAEGWWPRARQRRPLRQRWLANLGVFAITRIAFWWLSPLSLLGAAFLANQRGWGLFNWVPAPEVVAVAVSLLVLDLSTYVEHRLKHRIPLLWRIHRLHHSDPGVDVTTSLRHHPFELLLRATGYVAVATAIGMPPVAAVGYLLITAVTSVLSHADLRLPGTLCQALGMIVITPDNHRTHHSIDHNDGNSNFGICLSCWDRLFGTYRAIPTLGHENIVFGVESCTIGGGTSVLRMLADPFVPERAHGPLAPSATGRSVDLSR